MAMNDEDVALLSPWRAGIDTLHGEHTDAFQLNPDAATRLTAAVNVDINDFGEPSLRAGTTNRRTGTAYKNIVSCAGLLLAQDGGSVYTIDPDDSYAAVEAVTGLNATAKVQFVEFAGAVFYTNGLVCGKILAAGTSTHWGLTVPPAPTVTGATGCATSVEDSFPAGSYLLAATVQDASGRESGASPTTTVTVDGSGSITAALASTDSNATHVNFYVTGTDQKKALWCKKVAVGSLPATITDTRVTRRPLLTQFLRGPIPGDGVSRYLGYVLLWRDNIVFRSRGQVPDLFHPQSELLTFPYDVRSVLGLKSGFYVATERTLHWVSGESPRTWGNEEVGRGYFAAGGAVRPGREIPRLQTSKEVALFAGKQGGLIAGLPGGQVVHILDDQLKISTAPTSADVVYVERDELRQIIMLLR